MLPIIRLKLKEMIVMMIKKKRKKEDMGLIDCLLILLPKCQQN
jgi:hypothetical protein